MKTTYKIVYSALALLVLFGCEDLSKVTPAPNSNPSNLAANFVFANATIDSAASSQKFYVNGVLMNTSDRDSSQHGYLSAAITSNGTFANTTLFASGTAGGVGGVLGSKNLYYRSSSTSTSGFTASNGFSYTIISADSLTRPAPARKLNAGGFGDTTFYNVVTGSFLSTVDRKALSAAQKAQLIQIGTVPLGCTDPGGPRFWVSQDPVPTFPNGNTTQAAIRFVNLVPNSYQNVTSGTNFPSYPTVDQRLWVKLVPTSGSSITVGSATTYAFAGSIGSTLKTSGNTFSLQTTAPGGVASTYSVVVATNSSFNNSFTIPGVSLMFLPNKFYTIHLNGWIGKDNTKIGNKARGMQLKVGVIKHN
ncbi:MAG TPA: hypothetical protein DGG95_10965 [Cytophagales bacterium]|jgi:hypothetical protein|nr:hypothetical protein [Cytophagales bacterium]